MLVALSGLPGQSEVRSLSSSSAARPTCTFPAWPLAECERQKGEVVSGVTVQTVRENRARESGEAESPDLQAGAAVGFRFLVLPTGGYAGPCEELTSNNLDACKRSCEKKAGCQGALTELSARRMDPRVKAYVLLALLDGRT